MIEVALDCIKRGWHVFPCRPKTKEPAVMGGFHRATVDENQIREWWSRWPDANVGIATGASGLTVLDIDHGARDVDGFAFRVDLPSPVATYTVRTGRTDGVGLQMYFAGGDLKSIPWELGELSGDIRSATGYVMAAGSVHPSGGVYECVDGNSVAQTPAFVRELRSAAKTAATDDGLPITEHRNSTLTSIAGKLRNAGLSAAALESALLQVNADRCEPPLPEAEVQRIAANASRWELPAVEPEILLGKPKPEKEPLADWRMRYHTPDDLLTVTPGRFMVEGILFEDSIVGLAGYAGDRKSIVSLNLAAACVTGTPFMGRFAVTNPPQRVLYLCPEMGLRELAKRAQDLGMMPYVGKGLFFRTLDKEGKLRLAELTAEELDGALVILDTAIRFLEGSENDPQDMAVFADSLFRLRSAGATVWVLFHSSKASAGQDLTLQNAVRGSSELAAMLSMCWATRLNDPADRFGSLSRMYPMKVRDFEAVPFEFSCDRKTAACQIVGEPAPEAVLRNRKDDAARAALAGILKATPDLGINRLREEMKAAGYGRGQVWVTRVRGEILREAAERPYSETHTP